VRCFVKTVLRSKILMLLFPNYLKMCNCVLRQNTRNVLNKQIFMINTTFAQKYTKRPFSQKPKHKRRHWIRSWYSTTEIYLRWIASGVDSTSTTRVVYSTPVPRTWMELMFSLFKLYDKIRRCKQPKKEPHVPRCHGWSLSISGLYDIYICILPTDVIIMILVT